MASLTEHPSTAAILTLSVTVGTWVISFFGAVQGGLWERAAGFTPASMVAEFQHGLVRLDVVLIALVLILTGLAFAGLWMRFDRTVRRRTYESLTLGLLSMATILACTLARPSWDLSENRANSFSRADEAALRQVHGLLRIEVHLAAEDPRRVDLESHVLGKLRRVLPDTQVEYVAATSIGLFEQTSKGYGEVWYSLDGRRQMSRMTTEEGVLETIYSLAHVTPPKQPDEEIFRGHPLAVAPTGASALFYLIWPAVVLASGIFVRGRFR
jgi:hypothetical protein